MNLASVGVRLSRFATVALTLGAAWRGIATVRVLREGHIQVPVVPIVGLVTTSSSDRDDAVDSIVERNLFRPDRVGAVESSSSSTSTPAPTPPTSIQPPVLRGLAGGPPWSIVLENLPGRPAAVVIRQGATFAGLRLIAVRHDTAVVRSKDTTWKLVLGRP